MYDKVVSGYNNAPASFTTEQKKKLQQNKIMPKKNKRCLPEASHFYSSRLTFTIT